MKRGLLGLAAVVLTAVFMYVRFPYDRLAERIASKLEATSPWRVDLVDPGPRPTLFGPGVSAGPVRVQHSNGLRLDLDTLVLRPAWSTSWLRLTPAIHFDIESTTGNATGTLTLDDPPHLEAGIEDADLAAPFGAGASESLILTGQLDADLDLSLAQPGPEGPVHLTARQGSIGHPVMPLDLPFDRLDAVLLWGGNAWLHIESANIQSPMLTGELQGTVGKPPGGPLDVRLDLEPDDSARAMLQSQGLRIGRDGRLSLQLGGSTSQPTLR